MAKSAKLTYFCSVVHISLCVSLASKVKHGYQQQEDYGFVYLLNTNIK